MSFAVTRGTMHSQAKPPAPPTQISTGQAGGAGGFACRQSQKGFTLIELMISITLVTALATGMMLAMRTSLLSMEKINSRLQFNRRVMGMEHILTRQIGGVMPVVSDCGSARIPIFNGTSTTLRLVSSYSMAEGARGYPQFDEFQVVPREGGLRLIVTEHLYTGPSSTSPFCGGQAVLSTQSAPLAYVVADRLATCTFSYREQIPDQLPSSNWLPSWDRQDLPAAVKIEMTPLDASPALLPVMNVTVPIHVNRQVRNFYEDAP